MNILLNILDCYSSLFHSKLCVHILLLYFPANGGLGLCWSYARRYLDDSEKGSGFHLHCQDDNCRCMPCWHQVRHVDLVGSKLHVLQQMPCPGVQWCGTWMGPCNFQTNASRLHWGEGFRQPRRGGDPWASRQGDQRVPHSFVGSPVPTLRALDKRSNGSVAWFAKNGSSNVWTGLACRLATHSAGPWKKMTACCLFAWIVCFPALLSW